MEALALPALTAVGSAGSLVPATQVLHACKFRKAGSSFQSVVAE
jgi:hypothetical protein